MSATMVELKEITYSNLSRIIFLHAKWEGGGGYYGLADREVFYIYVSQKNIVSVPP